MRDAGVVELLVELRAVARPRRARPRPRAVTVEHRDATRRAPTPSAARRGRAAAASRRRLPAAARAHARRSASCLPLDQDVGASPGATLRRRRSRASTAAARRCRAAASAASATRAASHSVGRAAAHQRRRASSSSGIPSSTAQTPSVIGSSTPMPARRGRAARAPSSAPRRPGRSRARASSGVAPRAISSPARRLRPDGCQHVHDQVAHPGEPGERLRLGAARLAEPRHLDEAARDQRRLRVVAEPEPVDAAGRERDHVLRRGAELDADQVGR